MSGGAQLLEPHRREVTILFCDLRGFTAFAANAEPEEVMGALSQFYQAVGELILRYEATLEQFAGNSIMAIFNDPMPCVEHTATAVRMAVEIRERMQALTDAWRRNGFDLDAGIGIAQGYATLGRVGFEGRFDYRATGTVVNLASRLCSQALGGQILISPRAYATVTELGGRRTGRPTPAQGIPRPCERVQRDAPQGVVADVRAVRYLTSSFRHMTRMKTCAGGSMLASARAPSPAGAWSREYARRQRLGETYRLMTGTASGTRMIAQTPPPFSRSALSD